MWSCQRPSILEVAGREAEALKSIVLENPLGGEIVAQRAGLDTVQAEVGECEADQLPDRR